MMFINVFDEMEMNLRYSSINHCRYLCFHWSKPKDVHKNVSVDDMVDFIKTIKPFEFHMDDDKGRRVKSSWRFGLTIWT